MRIKTDENIANAGIALLREAGHDVATVHQQGLSGAVDTAVFQACVAEERILVTLDRDFGQVLRFPPARTAGVVILELGGPASLNLLVARLREFVALASIHDVRGALWIVEPGRLRRRVSGGDD